MTFKLKENKWIISVLIGIILLISAFLFYSVSKSTTKYYKNLYKDGLDAYGVIEEVFNEGEVNGITKYSYVVKYKVGTTENGEYIEKEYEFETKDYTQEFHVGTRVRVKYDANTHEGVIVRSVAVESIYIVIASVLLVVGFALIVQGSASFVRNNKMQIETSEHIKTIQSELSQSEINPKDSSNSDHQAKKNFTEEE